MIIIGHRGAKGLAPENTLKGFAAGLQQHVDMIEFDVRLTKDGALVLNHDWHLAHISGSKRPIRVLTLAQVQRIGKQHNYEIPTLQQALEFLHGKVKINIEIKSYGAAAKVYEILQPHLQKGLSYDDVIVSSFLLPEIRAIKKIDTKLNVAILYSKRFAWRYKIATRLVDLYGIGMQDKMMTPKVMRQLAAEPQFIYVYTVNDPKRAKQLGANGVQGICTDRPDLVNHQVFKQATK